MIKKCPDCETEMIELKKALVNNKERYVYPKTIAEPGVKKVFNEYRFYCEKCKKEWVYDSLRRYFSELPEEPTFIFNPEKGLLALREENENE